MWQRMAALLAVGLVIAISASASAAALRIGLAAETTSVDPHFQDIGPNYMLKQHVFDSLVDVGPNQELLPGLAPAR